MDRDLEGLLYCGGTTGVVVQLAVPVRPGTQGINGLDYVRRRLRVGEQRHAHWVRPPELRVEAGIGRCRGGTSSAGRTGCLRRREIEPHLCRRAAAGWRCVPILEHTIAAGHTDGDVQRLHTEITGQVGVTGGEPGRVDIGFEWERG